MKSNRCGTRSLHHLGAPAAISMRDVKPSCEFKPCVRICERKVKELHGCGTKAAAAAAFTRTKLLVGLPVSLK